MHKAVNELKEALRQPYTWPGAYTKAIYLSDGERICPVCARENFRLIVQATKAQDRRSGWGMLGVEVYWEGPPEVCCQCCRVMRAEYGDPDTEEGTV